MEHLIKNRVSLLALERARLAAEKHSTPTGRSKGGWVRLARVESRTGREVAPYVIAIRAIASARMPIQFGCSCPDWYYRKRRTGEPCKHQREFLRHMGGSSPGSGLWLYRAGAAFLESIQGRKFDSHEK